MAGAYTFFTSGAEVVSSVLQLTGGQLGEAFGSNNTTDPVFVQVHDRGVAPAGGEIPEISFRVGPGAAWSINELVESVGLDIFVNGITIAYSTTADTFTAPAGNVGWIHGKVRD